MWRYQDKQLPGKRFDHISLGKAVQGARSAGGRLAVVHSVYGVWAVHKRNQGTARRIIETACPIDAATAYL